jgi:ABC-2 type transport system ATP-binding protein
VLLSTHILSEAQQICDRVLIINKGHIAAEDTPERLQARLTGSGRISLKIKGDDDGLETALKKIPGIVTILPQGDGAYEVSMAAGQDLRPEIARVVVNGGFDLLEIHPLGISLEEIFMELTRDEPQPPAVSDEGLVDDSKQE